MAFSNAITSPSPLRSLGRTSSRPVITPRAFAVKCNQKSSEGASFDRRGMLIGLGGLYGIATQVAPPAASATVAASAPAIIKPTTVGELPNCHLTMSDKEVDYEFPAPGSTPLRVRPAAHLVDADYIAKYGEALRRMKSLPESHPFNFYTHAMNHEIKAHDNYLFLPWHRFYIYFYERILGKLIDDPTFALPFWNWDNPEGGMSLPAIFLDPNSALYNPTRDAKHLPPAVLDFWYIYGAGTPQSEDARAQRRAQNVEELRKAFRQSLGRATLFMGDPPAPDGDGVDLGSAGRIDSIHKAIHQWVGPAEAPWMDMGNIHKSTRDPVFYSLHGGLDRLWEIYRTFRGGGPDFNDPAYLDAVFHFTDENGRKVRVKVRDCMDPLKMGYTYQDVPNPWAGHQNIKPVYVSNPTRKPTTPVTPVGEFGSAPRKLDAPVRILVDRPKAMRSSLEKAAELEVLQLNGVDVVPSGPGRLDIYISAPVGSGDYAGPDYGEFAGSYVKPLRVHSAEEAERVAKSPPQGKRRKGSLTLGITPLLEDMDAENAEKLVVTLVPTDGDITIDGIGINYLPADRPLLL